MTAKPAFDIAYQVIYIESNFDASKIELYYKLFFFLELLKGAYNYIKFFKLPSS